MAIYEHTPPPCPPLGGFVDDLTWTVSTNHRHGLIGLLAVNGAHDEPHTLSSLWLAPADAEKVGHALLAAVAAWRATQ